MISAEEQRTTLLALYPLFKEEVYRRRHEMMRWTAVGAGSLVAVLLILLLAPTARELTLGGRLFLGGGLLLLTLTFAGLILQQQTRRLQAKHTLIELERSLGLFDADVFLDRRPLYPERWQTDWKHDLSATLALTVLGLLTIINLSVIAFLS